MSKKKIVFLPYDFDTANGIDNYGRLVFSYELEDIDYTEGGETVYSGQNSVLWKNVRAAFHSELTTMYRDLRGSGALSYAKIEKMFEDHQAKWPEVIFNEDGWFKYILPLVNDNDGAYLPMMLGSKEQQRKWWMYNRFKYIDSKYNAGDAAADSVTFRGFALPDADTQGVKGIDITPYADIYATVLYGVAPASVRTPRNTTKRVPCSLSALDFTDIHIYSASQIKSFGDLSAFKPDAVAFANATHVQELKFGDADSNYSNGNLKSLTLGNNKLLKKLDVRNCVNLGTGDQKSVDLSGCEIIEEVYFDGTKIQGLSLPNGGMVKKLHLPGTMANLTIMNQKNITEFVLPDYSNITTLRIENCASIIPVGEILEDMAANSRVRLIGFTMAVTSTDDVEDFYDYLDTMRGLDESGITTDTAVVQGTITGLDAITGAWYAQMKARYPFIDITYNHISAIIKFYNGTTLLQTSTILDGADATYTGSTPTKTQDAQYTYAFAGWSKDADDGTVDSDALTHIEADRNVYACFTSTLRTYTVTWKNADNTTLETDTNVPYGSTPQYNGATPTYQGETSTGWTPPISTVTGDITYTASYVPTYTVYFYNGDTLLQSVQVQEGGTAVYTGETPTSEYGTFEGWDKGLDDVNTNLYVHAVFDITLVEPDLKYLVYTKDDTNMTMIITGVNVSQIVADDLQNLTIPDTIQGYHVIIG